MTEPSLGDPRTGFSAFAPASRPELAGLAIADPPERWRALGFHVDDADTISLGGVSVCLGASGGPGIVGWSLRNVAGEGEIEGLPTSIVSGTRPHQASPHPNGSVSIDHVVVVTPEFDRTAAALEERGLGLRRVRQAGERRQGFRRLGPAIVEIVEAPEAPRPAFWGLTVVARDLAAVEFELAAHMSPIRPAVQPGRQITTVGRSAGLSTRLAFMDPE